MGAVACAIGRCLLGLGIVSVALVGCRSADLTKESGDAREITGLHNDRKSCDQGEGTACPGGTNPVLVANPDRQEYLLLWQGEYRSTEVHLYARRVNAKTGEPIGASVSLTGLDDRPASIAAAYDRRSRQYVVVWRKTVAGPPIYVTTESEIITLNADAQPITTTAVRHVPPSDLVGLTIARDGRPLLASLQYSDRPAPPGGRKSVRPLLVLTPVNEPGAAGRPWTVGRSPRSPGALEAGLAAAPSGGRVLVTVSRAPDAYERPGMSSVPFVIRLVNGQGRTHAASRFAAPAARIPLSVRLAFNPRASTHLAVWSSFTRPDRREILAHALDAQGVPIGSTMTVARAENGDPSGLGLDVGATREGFAISWRDSASGWVTQVDSRGSVDGRPRMVFRKPGPGETFYSAAATNAGAHTHAQAWTEGVFDEKGQRIYVRVVPLR